MNILPEDVSASDVETHAVASRAEALTVALMDKDGASGEGGSAVKIRIGERFFLATAAHVIAEPNRLAVVPKIGDRCVCEFASSCSEQRNGVDLGVLEVRPQDVKELGDFVSHAHLLPRIPNTKPWNLVLVGFPSQTAIDVGAGTTVFVGGSYRLESVPEANWPNAVDLDLDARRDLLLGYPKTGTIQIAGPNKVQFAQNHSWPGSIPKPHGLSGGGIWLPCRGQMSQSGIWFPCPYLIAVQVGYFSQSNTLRGVFLDYLLKLIGENYPDTRELVDKVRKT